MHALPSKQITIIPYRTEWVREFRLHASRLRAVLGDQALRIDHIGSTAVPGLAAKDIIDIQITAAGLTEAARRALVETGYAWRADVSGDHLPPGATDENRWIKWLFKSPNGERPVNVHLRIAGFPNQRYALLFRDFLRANSLAAGGYAQVKIALARLHPHDQDAYYDVKDPVCDIIMAGAEVWAATTSWQPGVSDV